MKRWLCGILIVVSLFTLCTGCGSNKGDTEDTSTNERDQKITMLRQQFHLPFLEATDVPNEYQSKKERVIKKAVKLMEKDSVGLDTDSTFWGKKYYTLGSSIFIRYYGDMKKDRPEGFGIITYKTEDGEWPFYIGEFKKGQFHGYGALFSHLDSSQYIDLTDISELLPEDKQTPEFISQINSYLNHHVIYDGEWKNGKESGKGNTYSLVSDMPMDQRAFIGMDDVFTSMIKNQPSNYWASFIYPIYYYSGEFDDDKETGDGVSYSFGEKV